MHPRVAIETQPAVAMHPRVATEYNQRLQPLAFYSKNKDCVKLLFCEVFFASAGTLFGAAIQRL